ncbi:TetR/AcrR family transcriptional regulator [Burkholderia sp. TSV86]|uniref:TetR/AcrR family transcriptional regulator n=1 Tax=Burkholderia sp. TSV86 TaxID=1385594 RepID=UPI0009EA705B|nr:TetR/AcrR family transcriptional regulator [Burkholderia sp. TSV86]
MRDFPQPRKRPRQARSAQTVELILEATARLLAERGYACMTTNMVAERAGVSVGSVYQYFPNKSSLVAALHERHAVQIRKAIEQCLATRSSDLGHSIEAVVRAMMAEHENAPALHQVLEQEFRFFDAPLADSPADTQILCCLRTLLEKHQHEVAAIDLDLAAWTLLQVAQSLVHAAVIDPPWQFAPDEIERSIVRIILGFLRYTPVDRADDTVRPFLGDRRQDAMTAARQLRAEAS